MANSSDRVKGGARLGPPGSFKEVVVLKPVRFVILAFAVGLAATSSQGTASPVHQMARGGAIAAGDPVQAWDKSGNLFYMGNNFNRGIEDGISAAFRDNTGDVWVATYGASDPNNTGTDGSRYVRTVILATNVFGLGSFNDKTGIQVDQATGNVYAAWSDFHGSGCNEIVFSRSTDHGATFSAPMKIS